MRNPAKLTGHSVISRFLALVILIASMGTAAADDTPEVRRAIHDSRESFLVYDLPNFPGTSEDLASALRDSLSYRGNTPQIQESQKGLEVPAVPLRMKTPIKGEVQRIEQWFPSCPGATWTARPYGIEITRNHFKTSYLACVFPYEGGLSVNLYIVDRFTGIDGVCEPNGVVMYYLPNCNPYEAHLNEFLDFATARLKSEFLRRAWKYSKTDMNADRQFQ